ncbi:hypothetical protein MNBD_NITROSPINAE03-196, partial [hydrothermal vent metagenome]
MCKHGPRLLASLVILLPEIIKIKILSIINSAWQFLLNEDNRGALQIVGGAIVAIVVAVWGYYKFRYKDPKPIHPLNTITLSLDEYDKRIRKIISQTREEYKTANLEERQLLAKELAGAEAKLENVEEALEEHKKKLKEADASLEKFKERFGAKEVEKA